MFCTFWLANVLRATAACHFPKTELQKLVRACGVLGIFNWKCASRYSGAPFFISLLNSYLRTRRFSEPTFRTSGTTNHWKNIAICDFPNIWRMCSFFWLYSRVDRVPTVHILSEVGLLNFLRSTVYILCGFWRIGCILCGFRGHVSPRSCTLPGAHPEAEGKNIVHTALSSLASSIHVNSRRQCMAPARLGDPDPVVPPQDKKMFMVT